MKRSINHNRANNKSFTTTNLPSAKRKAYFGYLAYRAEALSTRKIEDALLTHSAMPKVSSYGLEENSLLDGWWYTGIDEERFDQIIDTFSNPSFKANGAM